MKDLSKHITESLTESSQHYIIRYYLNDELYESSKEKYDDMMEASDIGLHKIIDDSKNQSSSKLYKALIIFIDGHKEVEVHFMIAKSGKILTK